MERTSVSLLTTPNHINVEVDDGVYAVHRTDLLCLELRADTGFRSVVIFEIAGMLN